MVRMSKIGNNIRTWRLKREYGVNELARLVPMDRSNLSKYEKGTAAPSLELLALIAVALRIPMSELVEGEGFKSAVQDTPHRVRVLAWNHVGRLDDIIRIVEGNNLRDTEVVAAPSSINSFALKIEDDANSPEFGVGEMIVIDPHKFPRPGRMALAVDADGAAVFRRFVDLGLGINGQQEFELHPLNEVYPIRYSARETLRIVGGLAQHRRIFLD